MTHDLKEDASDSRAVLYPLSSATATTTLTYFAFFDIGEQAGSIDNERLNALVQTHNSSVLSTYDVSSGVINSRSSETEDRHTRFPNLLTIYRDEMYRRRIAAFARTNRFGQMYQLMPFSINGLLKGHQRHVILASDVITCHPVISVTNLGIACIQLWMQLPGRFWVSDVIQFSDPADLFVPSVDYSLGLGGQKWTLQRQHISVLNIMSFIAAQLLCELGALHISSAERQSQHADWRVELQKARPLNNRDDIDLPHLEYIETYTAHHLDYRGNNPKVGVPELKKIQQAHGAAIRALIKTDVNWSHKKTDVVNRHLEVANCTTRDSILWFVAPQGIAKLYSEELETDLYVSMVLATFEVELLLGMRYFLEKINYSLNTLSLERTKPQLLARIHRQNIERLDSFFSLATCTKDTTAERLEKLKGPFGITQLSATTAEKISALSALVSAHHDEHIQRSQSILTILFGLFGAGQLVSAFFFWYYSVIPQPTIRRLLAVIIFTMFLMGLIGLSVYMLGQRKARPSNYGGASNDKGNPT